MATSITCTYDPSKLQLNLQAAVSSNNPAGTVMIFTVSGFQNPYNGMPKSGFVLTTYESTGVGMVD